MVADIQVNSQSGNQTPSNNTLAGASYTKTFKIKAAI